MPQIFQSVVRSADMNRTPDVRTRAILPEWAAKVRVRFVKPVFKEQAIANLMAAAGLTAGVGDFRQEKGKGNFGLFRLVSDNDADFLRVIREGGMAAQDAALRQPESFDQETRSMLEWFDEELVRREGKRKAA